MESSTKSIEQCRTEPRRKIFLSASLGIGESTTPCCIKNITTFGALIQCNATMSIGATIIIRRGELRVAGEIEWARDAHFGVSFSDRIEIQEWFRDISSIPSCSNPESRNFTLSNSSPKFSKEEGFLDDSTVNLRLAEELLYISRIVEGIGEVLVKDPLLRVRHAASIQQLDMGQQMLSEIAKLVSIENKYGSITRVATGPMRGRLLRAKRI